MPEQNRRLGKLELVNDALTVIRVVEQTGAPQGFAHVGPIPLVVKRQGRLMDAIPGFTQRRGDRVQMLAPAPHAMDQNNIPLHDPAPGCWLDCMGLHP